MFGFIGFLRLYVCILPKISIFLPPPNLRSATSIRQGESQSFNFSKATLQRILYVCLGRNPYGAPGSQQFSNGGIRKKENLETFPSNFWTFGGSNSWPGRETIFLMMSKKKENSKRKWPCVVYALTTIISYNGRPSLFSWKCMFRNICFKGRSLIMVKNT